MNSQHEKQVDTGGLQNFKLPGHFYTSQYNNVCKMLLDATAATHEVELSAHNRGSTALICYRIRPIVQKSHISKK